MDPISSQMSPSYVSGSLWVDKTLMLFEPYLVTVLRSQEANIARVSVVARNGQLHETSAAQYAG